MCTCLENTTPCENQECGCKFEVDAGCVRYSGDNLDSAGIISGDTLETSLISIDSKLSELSPGDYITMVNEPAGDNCEFGGVKFELRDGTTDLIKSTSFICGVDTENNAQGSVQNVSFTTTENGDNVSSSITSSDQFPAITLNIPIASATTTGKITSEDWNKFNNKQDALLGTPNYIAKWSATDDLTDSIMYEAPSGLIGVGLTTPSAKFHISNTTTSDSFLVEDETNPDTTPFVIDNAGNVGIGVAAPSTKLQVLSATSIDNTTLANAPLLVGTSTLGIGIDANEIYAASELSIGTFGSTSSILFKANASQKMIVHAGGNVGIGTDTGFTPSAKLHVINTTVGNSLLVEDDTNPDSTPFVITSTGRVGIGELAPNTKLHIRQDQGGDNSVEEIARFGLVDINDSYLSIRNARGENNVFSSEIRGYQDATNNFQAVGLSGFINVAQDITPPDPTNSFKYQFNSIPAVLFRTGAPNAEPGGGIGPVVNRRLFEFKNWLNPILTMDPTGGIKVHRGYQDGVYSDDPNYVQGSYTQFTHMKGNSGGNFIVSHSSKDNAMALNINATTDVDNTLSTTPIDPTDPTLGTAHPSVNIGVYGQTAIVVDKDNNVGIGTFDTDASTESKLTVVSGTLLDPAAPGSALTVYEGVSSTNKVLISSDAIGGVTWGKINKDHMDPELTYSGFLTVATPSGGSKMITIRNGLITAVA